MRKIFFLSFIFFSSQLFSQHTDTARVIVYDAFNSKQTVDVKKDGSYEKNIFKWNIGMLGRGAFEMDFERCISKKFTVEAGAGVTYIDLMGEAFAANSDFSFDNATLKYGPLLTCDLKFYPKTVFGFEGTYISVPFRIRNYYSTQKLSYYVNNIQVTNTFNRNRNHSEYGFIVGYQSGDYWDLTWDYFFGIGINSSNSSIPVYDDNDIPHQNSEHKVLPVIFFGFKMGFPF